MANVKNLTNLIDKISKAPDCPSLLKDKNFVKNYKSFNIYLINEDTLSQICNNDPLIQNLIKLISYFLDPTSKLFAEKSSDANNETNYSIFILCST